MKVLTFSRYFPSYHPRKGELTFFIEKIWKDLTSRGVHVPNMYKDYFQNHLETDVLDDILNDWIKKKTIGSYELSVWLNSWKSGTWHKQSVDDLKDILKDEMPGMEAKQREFVITKKIKER